MPTDPFDRALRALGWTAIVLAAILVLLALTAPLWGIWL